MFHPVFKRTKSRREMPLSAIALAAALEFVPVLKTPKQAVDLPDSEIFSRPEFMVLDVGMPTRKDGGMACFMFSPPHPF